MMAFKKKLETFFVYFFAGISVLVLVLGINRVKDTDELGTLPASKKDDDNDAIDTRQANVLGAFSSTKQADRATADTVKAVSSTGKAVATPWGDVVASVKVKSGAIVAAEFQTIPDSPPSIYAKPFLIDQTLALGGANIQGVSGATITSNAFKASLENALAKARAQGGSISKSSVVASNSQPKKIVTPPPAPTPAPTIVPPQVLQSTTPTQPIAPAGVSGTFTGAPYGTPWGNAVATVTFTNGRITRVTMPQVPNSPPSVQAMPYLIDQALAAGNANIQGVSGATAASEAFRLSLENAIAQASAQGTVSAPAPTTVSNTPASTQQYNRYDRSRYYDDDEDDD